jgi:hypothetical protein
MRTKLGKVMIVAAALVCFLTLKAPAASADGGNVTYTFTGAGNLLGTSFSYESVGFLSSGAVISLTSADASDLIYDSNNYGQVNYVEFGSPTELTIADTLPVGIYADLESITPPYNIMGTGTYTLNIPSGVPGSFVDEGTLTISIATPEPSAVTLLAIGLVGLLILTKRKVQPFAG